MFQFDFAVFFYMRWAPHDFFAGIELKRVARPVEGDLPISTQKAVQEKVAVPYSDFGKFPRKIAVPNQKQESWDCQ